MKIELKHIAPYLPYSLPLFRLNKDGMWKVIHMNNGNMMELIHSPEKCKMVLKPLSELYTTDGFSVSKLITHGYHNEFWSTEKFSLNHVLYHDLQLLLQHHFDMFGLLDAGLAVTINKMPL